MLPLAQHQPGGDSRGGDQDHPQRRRPHHRRQVWSEDQVHSFHQSFCFRNLRLKAHTADCAVISIKEFMSWIKTVRPWVFSYKFSLLHHCTSYVYTAISILKSLKETNHILNQQLIILFALWWSFFSEKNIVENNVEVAPLMMNKYSNILLVLVEAENVSVIPRNQITVVPATRRTPNTQRNSFYIETKKLW